MKYKVAKPGSGAGARPPSSFLYKNNWQSGCYINLLTQPLPQVYCLIAIFVFYQPVIMSTTEEKSLNFIEEIVEEDLRSGKYKTILTRFPPEPNGYLHIGHAKSICLNFGLANKYGGGTNLRFDDTNPTTEETEYVESIKADVKWLGFNWAKRTVCIRLF